jgi:alpha-D-ribose 1-methylphosphonate 5-triphosphate diphosphatase
VLPAAYALASARACSRPDALALVSTNPARLAGLPDRGAIAPGLRADLAAVEHVQGHPVVRQVWRAGVPVLGLTGAGTG